MTGLVDRRHIDFLLDEVFDLAGILALPAFTAHDRETVGQVLDTATKLAQDAFLPSLMHLDAHEPRLENGRVVLPEAIGAALTCFTSNGFLGMAADAGEGGLGLPRMVANAAFLWFQAANVSIANYALLTNSAAELLVHHASPSQKARYLAPMLDGRFMGTMALSEPHAGSSLGDITTTARDLGEGRYALRGTKMWISGGEHDIGDNIVHLMLARIVGAPPGVGGLSLFIVPRRRLDATGRPSEWNNIAIAGLNHKMGQRGTVNTVLNVGESGDSIGEIVGRPGEGLSCMFTMMNEARIGVSMGAVGHASAAYLHALAYARDRLQGRPPDAKDPATPQIPIIAHADVRRMLLQQKAAVEGGAALGLYLARLADLKKAAARETARTDAGLLLDFLTPVFKAWISQETLVANENAMQVLGGAGYTRDHPLELHYRDNRLNPIHEGTNGIQAIDLVARKAVMANGRARALFRERLADAVHRARQCSGSGALAPLADALERAGANVETVFDALDRQRREAGSGPALANAHHVMDLVGLTAFTWMWLEQAIAADRCRGRVAGAARDVHDGTLQTARFVFNQRLPYADHLAALVLDRDDTAYAMREEWFG